MFMSRNGWDQTKSNAAFRIAARVRADLRIVSVGSGLTCNGDFGCLYFDIVSYFNDTTSIRQPASCARLESDCEPDQRQLRHPSAPDYYETSERPGQVSALRLIGDNALIYQGLGKAYYQYVNIGAAIGPEEDFIHKSESYADRIFELERRLKEPGVSDLFARALCEGQLRRKLNNSVLCNRDQRCLTIDRLDRLKGSP